MSKVRARLDRKSAKLEKLELEMFGTSLIFVQKAHILKKLELARLGKFTARGITRIYDKGPSLIMVLAMPLYACFKHYSN